MFKDFTGIKEFPARMFDIHDWCFRWAASVDNLHSEELFLRDMKEVYANYPEEVNFFLPRYIHMPDWERTRETRLILKGMLG